MANPNPVSPVNVVTAAGLRLVHPIDISIRQVGAKAYGLSTLPAEWCPPFFVISSDCLTISHEPEVEEIIVESIRNALEHLHFNEFSRVLIRSSGVNETLDFRGQLDSLECAAAEVWEHAQKLQRGLIQRFSATGLASSEIVHFVVQENVHVAAKGHLSNERRLNREPRDFVVEFEPVDSFVGQTEQVAVRTWRTGKFVDASVLTCDARAAIGLVLKRVASWAMRFSCRIHFEWVWNGKTVLLVQGDCATVLGGIDPRSVVPEHIQTCGASGLRAFRVVDGNDYATYRKLSNAKLYSELGYKMPPFYVLQDPAIISALLHGTVTDDLAADLKTLTQRPLIIRTDGLNIPDAQREMLPRSDELRTLCDAEVWFKKFVCTINELSLGEAGLCLIAHHFIPSVASAWARAEPGNPVVRIESLWGIPEGLYWHSHDTFEVDTGSRDINSGDIGGKLHYSLRERCRYKGTFIAPDDSGRWVPQATDANHDWARSITQKKWIFEIARTTRLIAEYSKKAVSVMWFIGNHMEASDHQVLPWFHSPSPLENGPKAAPRRKKIFTYDFVIRRRSDWEELKKSIKAGVVVERVVMSPEDADLIRNASFASELAQLAKAGGFIVELSGGILSHAYYMLSREGCRVECVDLFGAGEEVVEFNKLVRDKIPALIRDRGERIESITLKGDALVRALRQKLVEEAFEVLDASSGDDLLGELADVQEVLLALASALNLTSDSVEQERLRKRKRRGGFDEGMMLLKTSTPQSLPMTTDTIGIDPGKLAMEEFQEKPIPSISDPNALPVHATYRKPDLRKIGGATEKLFTFKTDIEAMRTFHQQLSFDMPTAHAGESSFLMTIELDREKSKIRGQIRLQLGPSQLNLFIE
jgi:predicted house-cleaning noncanonical NTP pyrophosphatase (MazG superfamily)